VSAKSDAGAIAKAAFELFQRGDIVGAERLLTPVMIQFKGDPQVQHLMGLIKKSQNKWEEAERHFRTAIAGALTKGEYYNDLGLALQARGANPEAVRQFRAALALLPSTGAVYVNLVRCLMAMNALDDAEREARAYVRVLPSAESWTLLSGVQRAQQHFEDALVSCEAALKFSPAARGLLHNKSIVLDQLGRAKEALEGFEALARESIDSPELAVNVARALHLAGRTEEAEKVLEQAVGHWRGNVRAHSALARMRWLRGAGGAATELIEAAVAERPQDLPLRLVCADLINRGGDKQKAAAMLEEGLKLAPDSSTFMTSLGIVYDEMGRVQDGLKLLREAATKSAFGSTAKKNLIATLLRASLADEALVIVRSIRREAPFDQQMLAHEAMALRMLGDAGYRDLYDYERLVRCYEIEPPRGFFSIGNFNAGLSESLRGLHNVTAHPIDQSLRNGSQTGRSLLEVKEPNIEAFLGAIEAPIRDYVGALGVRPNHPMDMRKGAGAKLASMWSVRLFPGGHHVNHIHGAGWISSAYYADLPAEIETNAEKAGWLKFGEPNLPTPGCTPDHFVKPRPGLLVLFPSYMWHGTNPFAEEGERLTMAFDVVPT
jgi:tetratricopeptide (TPR) repeat protein